MQPDTRNPSLLQAARSVLEATSIVLVGLSALAAVGITVAGAIGAVPMLSVPATIGDTAHDAGPLLQWGATVLLLAFLALGPALLRVRGLEARHRSFRVGMDDVTRAYWAAHAADRAGTFGAIREFDAVRERFEFLKNHPKYEDIEPEILNLAAQMSTEARELATIYSDEAVSKAQSSLIARRLEAQRLSDLIDTAHAVSRDIRRTLSEVELDEDITRARIGRLREDLAQLWEEIDGGRTTPRKPTPLRVAAE